MTQFDLSLLEADTRQVVCRLWPQLTMAERRIVYRPQPNLELGDLYFDGSFAVAEIVRVPPQEIAENLARLLSEVSSAQFSAAGGYINVRLACGESAISPPSAPTLPIFIYVPTASEAFKGWTALRLVARALLQYLIASGCGVSVRLKFGARQVAPLPTSGGDIASLVRELIRAYTDSKEPAEPELTAKGLAAMAREESCAAAVGWTLKASPSGGFERTFRQDFFSVEGVGGCIRCPAQSWFTSLEELQSPSAVIDWQDDALMSLFVYLAGEEEGRALDLLVPRVAEDANLSSLGGSVLQRLQRLALPRLSLPSCLDMPRAESMLVRRLRLFRLSAHTAATEGDVGEFLTLVSSSLRAVSALLNSPDVRQAIERGDYSGPGAQITAGVRAFFLDIMRTYPFLMKTGISPNGYDYSPWTSDQPND